jgi:hypothetical protein
MDEPKFCKDCRYCDTDQRCLHESARDNSSDMVYARWLVDGNGPPPPKHTNYACCVMRACACGPAAQYFEPIPVRSVA